MSYQKCTVVFLIGIFLFFSQFLRAASLSGRASNAAASTDKSFFSIDLGSYLEGLSQDTSAQSLESNFSGYLRARAGFPLFAHLYLEPSLGSLLPWRSSADGSTKTFQFTFALDFSYPIFSFLRFRLGPGVFTSLYVPGGEAVDLNNGTSKATFYTPNRFAAIFEFGIQSGFQIIFSNTISALLELYVLEPASSSNQTWNASASLGFNL